MGALTLVALVGVLVAADEGWRLPAVPVGEPETLVIGRSHPLAAELGRFRRLRYYALWDVDLQIEAWTEDDLGLFLQVVDVNGESLTRDAEGEGGPEVAVSLALHEGTLVHILVGSVEADETGTLQLVARESPDYEAWNRAPEVPFPDADAEVTALLEELRPVMTDLETAQADHDSARLQAAARDAWTRIREVPFDRASREVWVHAETVCLAGHEYQMWDLVGEAGEWFVEVSRRHFSPGSPEVMVGMTRIANARCQIGRLDDGLALQRQVFSLHERADPHDRSGTLQARFNLASTFTTILELRDAEFLLKQSIRDAESLWPPGDLRTETFRITLGQLRYFQDDAVGAAAILREVDRQLEATVPPQHPLRLQARITLGHCLRQLGDLPAARQVYEVLLPMTEASLPADAPQLQELRGALGTTLSLQGEWAHARELFEKMLAVSREAGREQTHRARWRQFSYVRNLRQQGELTEARALLEEFAAAEAESEDEQRLRRSAQTQLALLCAEQGDLEAADRILREALAGYGQTVSLTYLLEMKLALAAIESARGEEQAARARAREAWTQYRQLWTRDLPERWQLERSLAQADRQRGGFLTRLEGDPAGQLEVVMFHRTVSSRRHRTAFEEDGVHRPQVANLGESEVAVCITRHQPDHVGKDRYRRPRYLALLLAAGQDVQSIDLGPALSIDQKVERWLGTLTKPTGMDDGSGIELARQLLPDRLTRHLAPGTRLMLATDGGPAKIPWACLPRTDGRLLGDDVEVTYLDSLASLSLWNQGSDPARPGLLAVGGVHYDAQLEDPVDASLAILAHGIYPYSTPRSGSPRLDYLPHADLEVRRVAQRFREERAEDPLVVLRGDEATKQGFLEAASQAGVIHLATHGWFLSATRMADLDAGLLDRPDPRFQSPYERTVGLAPGQLCGVAFAGANAAPDHRIAQHPGILMADEVRARLDLRGCDLVVLSSCETTVGLDRPGLNLETLHRAFWLAGARTVVGSLWQVDDAATLALFEEFYRLLWTQKVAGGEALRRAQRRVREDPRHPDWRHPYYWGAWVLSGDPR